MYVTWQGIILAASVVSALGLLIGTILKVHKWYLAQELQSKQIDELRNNHNNDIKRVKDENKLICFALSACLDGLSQLGANHTVPIAKEKLDKYLNEQAHE
jgi:hypothetical protein